MNERTDFFIKIYLSHFILERVMFLVCERWVGYGDILLFWPKVLLATLSALLSHLGWVAQPWVTKGPKPSVCSWSQFSILSPTDSNWLWSPRAPGYIIVLRQPSSAVLPLIYTGASLDWRLGWVSVCYATNGFYEKKSSFPNRKKSKATNKF